MKQLTTSQTVDALGKVRAKIAQLEEEEAALSAELKKLGEGHVVGKLYEATIFKGTKGTVDMNVMRATLNPQFLDDNTKRSSYIAVKVTLLKLRG